MQLQGKNVILCVTGSIAAYKAADLVSRLRKQQAEVYVIMTKHACQFVSPLTFESLSGHPVVYDMFARVTSWEVEHISLAKRADVFVVAPATANVIGKMAYAIADDMLTTTYLATKAPVIVAPAMNTAMYEHEAVQHNLALLQARGVQIVQPAAGRLACGDTGRGKLAEVAQIEQAIADAVTQRDCDGLSVLVTAGPTQEAMDPVRYLTNHSTGKMGYALAARAHARGAKVTLVTGPTALAAPAGITVCPVTSAQEMYDVVLEHMPKQDIIIKSAAVGDYRPDQIATEKLKKHNGEMTITLVRNPDILAQVGACKTPKQTVCGFSMETQDLLENSSAKLAKKNCDMMVANNLKVEGAGFAGDTNVATLLYADGTAESVELMQKSALADLILDRLLVLHREKTI